MYVFLGANMKTIDTSIIDALGVNIMVADRDLNIIHMNPAVITLMREAEEDLRKELPHFSANELIGQNIDVFHKNPQHQRHLLGKLNQLYSTTIRVGQRAFDLRVSPMDFGYVVEWQDARPRLLNLDYEAQITAIGRSQSIIEFDLDGRITNANKNFLDLVGYTLDDVRGKHHGWFLDADVTAAPSYGEFWRRLNSGQFESGQYKLNGCGGRHVWIEASFNPILDHQGRISKIVAFSLDVTHQIKLLSDLKTLIDENFGELDAIVEASTTDAARAASAAAETSEGVGSIATAAEQFAMSFHEISLSMNASRSATENAYQQAEAAEHSTHSLNAAVKAMDGVVSMIRRVANQINLLALNAAIEAAHAGDAGKGFAVVAQEVKSLAAQAAKATEEIATEIRSVQTSSADVIAALNEISKAVNITRENVLTTSSALEEQNAVSSTMSHNMAQSAEAVNTVTQNIQAIATAVNRASEAVARTRDAAKVLVR